MSYPIASITGLSALFCGALFQKRITLRLEKEIDRQWRILQDKLPIYAARDLLNNLHSRRDSNHSKRIRTRLFFYIATHARARSRPSARFVNAVVCIPTAAKSAFHCLTPQRAA
jgi:hypothetical protein